MHWLLLLACSSTAPEPEAEPPAVAAQAAPDIVIVVVDTFRADRLGLEGYPRPTTPAIDALGGDGTWFHRAYAHSGWTLASFASLLTGQLPHEHRVGRDAFDPTAFGRIPAGTVTLAETLQAAGYATGAVVNNTFLAPEFGLQQGFDLYDWKGASVVSNRSAADTVDTGLAWLAGQSRPSFLLVHFMEPHWGYWAPEGVRGTFTTTLEGAASPPVEVPLPAGRLSDLQRGAWQPTDAEKAWILALYDEEVLAADHAIGRLADGLRRRGRWEQTLLVVTADHGEEHWDHGGFEHGQSLFGELTRVPLVLAGGAAPKAGRIDTVVSHSDLVATVQTASGLPVRAHGEDLGALAARGSAAGRTAISDNVLYGPPKVSIVGDSHRLVVDQAGATISLWKVDAQGGEREQETDPVVVSTSGALLKRQLIEQRGGLAAVSAVAGPEVPSAEVFEQLMSLGYVE